MLSKSSTPMKAARGPPKSRTISVRRARWRTGKGSNATWFWPAETRCRPPLTRRRAAISPPRWPIMIKGRASTPNCCWTWQPPNAAWATGIRLWPTGGKRLVSSPRWAIARPPAMSSSKCSKVCCGPAAGKRRLKPRNRAWRDCGKTAAAACICWPPPGSSGAWAESTRRRARPSRKPARSPLSLPIKS